MKNPKLNRPSRGRNRESRTKPSSGQTVSVRINISAHTAARLKALERDRQMTAEEILELGLQHC